LLANGNSTVRLSNVNYGGGKSLGDAVLFGGAAGNLDAGVTLTSSSFLGLFVESFSAGSKLEFKLSLSTNASHRAIPDRLTIFILDASGTPVATLAPAADYMVGVDLTTKDPSLQVFGSDPARPPFTGPPISIPSPRVED
jgi:hypothetical protein